MTDDERKIAKEFGCGGTYIMWANITAAHAMIREIARLRKLLREKEEENEVKK